MKKAFILLNLIIVWCFGDIRNIQEAVNIEKEIKKSCLEDKNASVCATLAKSKIKIAEKRYALIYELFLSSCDKDDEYACEMVVDLLSKGQGVEKNPAKAFEISKKTCKKAPNSNTCVTMAQAYIDGIVVKKDEHKGVDILDKMCEAKNEFACDTLGRFYENKGNNDLKITYYKKACMLDFIPSCTCLGVMYYEQRLYKQAFEYFDKSCKTIGFEADCFSAAKSLEKIENSDKNKIKAYYKKACDSGYSIVCK